MNGDTYSLCLSGAGRHISQGFFGSKQPPPRTALLPICYQRPSSCYQRLLRPDQKCGAACLSSPPDLPGDSFGAGGASRGGSQASRDQVGAVKSGRSGAITMVMEAQVMIARAPAARGGVAGWGTRPSRTASCGPTGTIAGFPARLPMPIDPQAQRRAGSSGARRDVRKATWHGRADLHQRARPRPTHQHAPRSCSARSCAPRM